MECFLHWKSFLFLALTLSPLIQCRRVPWWHIKMAQSQGPNTCAVEEVPGSNKKYWTECKYWINREICGVRTVIRYECCEGFQQVKHKRGCSGVKPMTNVLDTARDLGATYFVDYLTKAGLSDSLRQAGAAVTLFAPTNEAFEMITVNCGPLVRKDQEAKNGIVHLIDRVLVPPGRMGTLTIPEILVEDGRFRELATTLLQSSLVNELRVGGPYTLLAPSDESFQKIPPVERDRMTKDPEARLALLRHHVIPHTICAPGVIDKHKIRTLGGDHINFHCNESGTFVNDVKMTSEAMIAKNGVINLLTDVLVPDRARSVLDLAVRSDDLKTFTKLAHSTDVAQELIQANITITVFAPSDKAFRALPEERRYQLNKNPDEGRKLLQYHIIQGKVKTDTFSDSQKVDTIGKGNQLRLKVYRKALGVESAVITKADIEGQNGVLHIIDKVLTPPERSTLELLEENSNFSMFTDAIRRVQKVEPEFLSGRNPSQISFTIFAPTNKAFKRMGSHEMESLMNDEKSLKKFVQNHVVDNMMSSRSFHSRLFYDVHTEHEMVKVHKRKGHLMVNNAHIIEPDLVTKDGIVHCIDNVLMPKHHRHL
ncbi:transforming growth factor-beta-induced protein ig-h3-like isoform X2 [Tachypleus tridentatus]|uniref:transforming growth factor-beta-induced protein ig-h3-like isoform X2 n=1 Tax=Tachypleus tridentatus TaxID=6853 RepID=UPI003FD1C446